MNFASARRVGFRKAKRKVPSRRSECVRVLERGGRRGEVGWSVGNEVLVFYKATEQVGPRASSQLSLTSDQLFTETTTPNKNFNPEKTCTSRASPGPSSGQQLGDSLPMSTVSPATFFLFLSITITLCLANYIFFLFLLSRSIGAATSQCFPYCIHSH